ncbi:MAG: hypothetical protein HY650_05835, partial [Acidobacteria bacterium]|nr:hypothetical protein [Acidobacteriota bacterium]
AGTVPDVSIFGGDRGDVAGMALTAGQFNADDVSDLAIGAPLASGPDNMRLQAGEFYVVYGSPGLVSGSIIDIAGTAGPKPDVIVYGPVSGDQLSQHLALGDVNGDGRVDILSMGPFGGLGSLRPSAGTMYIVLGPLG